MEDGRGNDPQLSERVERSFRIARLVSGSDAEAEKLVRAAFARLPELDRGTSAAANASSAAKLYALLAAAGGARMDDSQPDAYDHDQARKTIARRFPVLFTQLGREEKLVLYLSEVEQLDWHDIGVVLRKDPPEAAELARSARERLRLSLQTSCSVAESELLHRCNPESWLREAIHNSFGVERTAPPSLLKQVARSLEEQTRSVPTPTNREPTRRTRSGVGRIATPVSLVLLVGLIGYAIALVVEDRSDADLLSLTASVASQTTPQLKAPSRTVATEFLMDQVGRRVRIPVIAGSVFQGAGVVGLTEADRAPVLYYEDATAGSKFTVTVYDYGMIDRLQETTELPSNLLRSLEQENALYVADNSRQRVAAWRHRADIFVASGPTAVIASLDGRITYAADDVD